MRYNSIGEYFYGLSNRCLGLVLLPVLLVLAAYISNYYFFSGLPWFKVEENMLEKVVAIETGIVFLLTLFMVWMGSSKIRTLMIEPSLGKRMAGYIPIVLIRFRMFSLMVFLVGTGVFLTGELMHLVILPVPVILILACWPLRCRMAKDLRLKPEEHDVLKNKNLGV